ncbi:radical SAM protein [Dehalococcoides mccartyi]|uniref:radical SAM protein n=2 Tax=Dehalococcoides TaxID=61434 RepID=UPI000783117F|nr:radical SAM protein [Dehalococcoides mccartyi]PKH45981.1 radical SAM protein [Dehalococcoides mccartyi]
MTNIYHIYYTPESKEVSLMFWGCNIRCRGCYCKRRIYSPMLKDFVGQHVNDDPGLAAPPERFLSLHEVMQELDKLDFERVLLEGQEASLDPEYAAITEMLHKRYGTYNVLLTNCYELPDLKDTDKVAFGIKAVSPELHLDYTDVPNQQILQNFYDVYKSGIDLVVESIYIPGYIDYHETENMAKFLSSINKDIPYVLLPYFKAGNNVWRRPTPMEMENAAEVAKKYMSNVYHFRGDEEIKQEVLSVFPEEGSLTFGKPTPLVGSLGYKHGWRPDLQEKVLIQGAV